MRTRVVVMGLALIAVVGALVWFWLLASVPRIEAGALTLEVEQPPVLVQAKGETAFRDATDGMALAVGDTVKTGVGGRAVVQFFGLAESRLDGDTALVVAAASQSGVETDALDVRLQLSAGRVWSRVVRLFDLESGFSVETPGIVATVRGTAFDVAFDADGETRVWVTDSVVGVLPVTARDRVALIRQLRGARDRLMEATTNTQALAALPETALGALPAGESATYTAAGTPVVHRLLTDADRRDAWFVANTQADEQFIQAVQDQRRAELARLRGARPDQLRAGITALSERAHLVFAGEARTEEQLEQYLVRRIARLLDLVEDGKTGLASQEFARLENEIRTGMRGEEGEAVRLRARAALVRTARLLEYAPPASPLYPFKQRLEDLLVALHEDDSAAALFTRLVAVDARIDEASQLLDAEDLETARVALNAARGGISNVSRDAEPILPTVSAQRQEALLGKVLALIAREASERARLEGITDARRRAAMPDDAGAADQGTTSTRPVTVPPVATPSSTPPAPTPPVVSTPSPEFIGIRLAVGVGVLTVGLPAPLGVIADRVDGSNADVSAKTTFRVVSGNGTLNGLQFTPTVAGVTVIEASYNDNGMIRTVQTGATAVGIATLQSVSVMPAGAVIKNGDPVTLRATAVYTDGSTRDVSASVTWSFAPTANGTMAGNVFTGINALRAAPAAVSVQAAYTEGGVTRVGVSSITVN